MDSFSYSVGIWGKGEHLKGFALGRGLMMVLRVYLRKPSTVLAVQAGDTP